MSKKQTYQQIITALNHFWSNQGCCLIPAYDMEMGAGTFHPATTLEPLSGQPWRAAYLQKVRRPGDGRYALNPNRLQSYFQYQVIISPSPENMQQLYLASLEAIGLDTKAHDIRFLEDNWASPTIGATGLGWEVWCDGIEVSQFTYFQQLCGRKCTPPAGEITYGTERLAMTVQDCYRVFDLQFDDHHTYGDLFANNEREQSAYNYQIQNASQLEQQLQQALQNGNQLLAKKLSIPAYEKCIQASHLFNLLDAQQALSTTARQATVINIRKLACACADLWLATYHPEML